MAKNNQDLFMDKEASNKTTPQNKEAASTDAPKQTRTRVVPQDAPKLERAKVAHSDLPRAAGKKPAFRATDGKEQDKYASHRTASGSKPLRLAAQDTRRPGSSSTSKGTANSVNPRTAASKDETNKSVSNEVTTEGQRKTLTLKTGQDQPMDVTPSKDQTTTPTTEGQNPWILVGGQSLTSSKKRRLRAQAKAAKERAEAADAARTLADVGSSSAEASPRGTASAGVSGPSATASDAVATGPVPKRSMKPRGKKSFQPDQHPQKRARPEDTTTPTGEGKRNKPDKPWTASGPSRSYAEAASFKKNDMCVAVMTETQADMTPAQAEQIRQLIDDKIMETLLKDLDASLQTEPNDLRFRGKAHFSEGALKYWCEDAFTLDWLHRTVDDLASPIEDTKLVVLPQSAIKPKMPCVLFVPGFVGDNELLRKLIARQNRHLNVKSWTMTHARIRDDQPGTNLFFRVPSSDVEVLRETERRMYYLSGNIYIRFMRGGRPKKELETDPKTANNPTEPQDEMETAPLDDQCSEPDAEAIDYAEAEPTEMDASSPLHRMTSEDECFPEGGEEELSESCLNSSPSRKD